MRNPTHNEAMRRTYYADDIPRLNPAFLRGGLQPGQSLNVDPDSVAVEDPIRSPRVLQPTLTMYGTLRPKA